MSFELPADVYEVLAKHGFKVALASNIQTSGNEIQQFNSIQPPQTKNIQPISTIQPQQTQNIEPINNIQQTHQSEDTSRMYIKKQVDDFIQYGYQKYAAICMASETAAEYYFTEIGVVIPKEKQHPPICDGTQKKQNAIPHEPFKMSWADKRKAWVCKKRHPNNKRCQYSIVGSQNQFFSGQKMKINDFFCLLWNYFCNITSEVSATNNPTCENTLLQWITCVKEVMMMANFQELKSKRLGGVGRYVQLDGVVHDRSLVKTGHTRTELPVLTMIEVEYCKQWTWRTEYVYGKNGDKELDEKGKPMKTRVKHLVHHYKGRKMVAIRVPDKSKCTLFPLIERFVLPGTQILTDKVSAYRELGRYKTGHQHSSVETKYSLVTPKRPSVHVNTISIINKRLWKSIKNYHPGLPMDHEIAAFVFNFNNFSKNSKVHDKMAKFGYWCCRCYPGIGKQRFEDPHWFFVKTGQEPDPLPTKLLNGVNIRGRSIEHYGRDDLHWSEEDSDIESLGQMVDDQEMNNDQFFDTDLSIDKNNMADNEDAMMET